MPSVIGKTTARRTVIVALFSILVLLLLNGTITATHGVQNGDSVDHVQNRFDIGTFNKKWMPGMDHFGRIKSVKLTTGQAINYITSSDIMESVFTLCQYFVPDDGRKPESTIACFSFEKCYDFSTTIEACSYLHDPQFRALAKEMKIKTVQAPCTVQKPSQSRNM